MGTRSCIGIGTPEGFKGVYVHWDGYPAHVGRVLLTEVRAAGVSAFAAFIGEGGDGSRGLSTIDTGFLTAPIRDNWTGPKGSCKPTHLGYIYREGDDGNDYIESVKDAEDVCCEYIYLVSENGRTFAWSELYSDNEWQFGPLDSYEFPAEP